MAWALHFREARSWQGSFEVRFWSEICQLARVVVICLPLQVLAAISKIFPMKSEADQESQEADTTE